MASGWLKKTGELPFELWQQKLRMEEEGMKFD
jgi:hypothetical protein